jgi:hypothetical protein
MKIKHLNYLIILRRKRRRRRMERMVALAKYQEHSTLTFWSGLFLIPASIEVYCGVPQSLK